MKTYFLLRRQVIPKPLDAVFGFFESPANLERITPAEVGFNILTPQPITMRTGAVLDYTIRLFGIPVRWTTQIVGYDPPYRFADVALKSPYSFWHHTHSFEPTPGGTVMTDQVKYVMPFGWIGQIAHALFVKRRLEKIFDYRAEVIEQLLEEQ